MKKEHIEAQRRKRKQKNRKIKEQAELIALLKKEINERDFVYRNERAELICDFNTILMDPPVASVGVLFNVGDLRLTMTPFGIIVC